MPTLAKAESVLLQPTHAGGLFARFSVDITNGGVSPNPFLADAIGAALAFCGVTPADPSAPTDADMARLRASDWPKFIDIAEVKLLEGAGGVGTTLATSTEWPDFKVSRSNSHQLIVASLTQKLDRVRAMWGYGLGTLTAGSSPIGRTVTTPEF